MWLHTHFLLLWVVQLFIRHELIRLFLWDCRGIAESFSDNNKGHTKIKGLTRKHWLALSSLNYSPFHFTNRIKDKKATIMLRTGVNFYEKSLNKRGSLCWETSRTATSTRSTIFSTTSGGDPTTSSSTSFLSEIGDERTRDYCVLIPHDDDSHSPDGSNNDDSTCYYSSHYDAHDDDHDDDHQEEEEKKQEKFISFVCSPLPPTRQNLRNKPRDRKKFKTELCKYGKNCKFYKEGLVCDFAHDVEELKEKDWIDKATYRKRPCSVFVSTGAW